MPTKVGEFFGAGVVPITHGANSEVAQWVQKTGSGLALDNLSDESLERATEFAVSQRPGPEALLRARLIAEAHFSLDSAARRYDALFRGSWLRTGLRKRLFFGQANEGISKTSPEKRAVR